MRSIVACTFLEWFLEYRKDGPPRAFLVFAHVVGESRADRGRACYCYSQVAGDMCQCSASYAAAEDSADCLQSSSDAASIMRKRRPSR